MLSEYSSDEVKKMFWISFPCKFIQIKNSMYKKEKKPESNKSCQSLIHSNMALKTLTWDLELVAKLF